MIILDDLGEPGVITKLLISGKQESPRRRYDDRAEVGAIGLLTLKMK